jgi:predicted  nucleic acid-binding Zn-ribbon protein
VGALNKDSPDISGGVMSTLNPIPPKPGPQEKPLIPESIKLILLGILLLAVVYLFYDASQQKKATQTELAKMADQIQNLETSHKQGEASLTSEITTLKTDLAGAQQAVGTTKAELTKTAMRIQAEGQKTKAELSKALDTKADASKVEEQVQLAKSEAENKIGQVSTEVGGVKTQVGAVKADLESTRRDLEGTQRQLLDVRDSLSAAVAKNSTELSQLRLKGERDYFEFTLPKKNEPTKVEDIRLVLTKTDAKKGKFNLKILVDDSTLEKKDRSINEPIQFLVGQHRVRYEVVINWVQKNKAGGYLSIPKDKSLSAERSAK